MRADSLGLFWQDLPKVKERGARGPRERGPAPPIPDTGWKTPTEFPNLSAAKVLGFDTETFDPDLIKSGPGWARSKGHIIGASLAVEDGTSWYFPMRHETQPETNMDPDQVTRFLTYTLKDNRPKVGANLIYDLGWAKQEGIEVGGKLYDVQFAEALLDSETPDVALDALAHKYLDRGKETSILYDWLASWLGGRPTERQRANLYLSPPRLAGPYAEADAALPIKILEKQWTAMARRGVLELFDIECRLIPLLVRMRFKGAPVDLNYAEKFHEELSTDLSEVASKLRHIAGQEVNPNARDSMAAAFRKLGIPLPETIDTKTKEKKISFAAPVLEEIDHELASAILEHRRIEKIRNTFVKGYILDKNVNGKVHCSFHPLRGDGHGARSGRFSSSDPNLQNIPVRTTIGKRVRKAFVATHGGRWRKFDYSQIEYRMLAHHAVGPGADLLRQSYNDNPDIDYHDFVADLIKARVSIDLPRRSVKNINFGLIYGMSRLKLIMSLGLSKSMGEMLYGSYHEAAPYAKETMDAAALEVDRLGYVETILGRKSDFDRWSKKGWDEAARGLSLSYDAASQKWGSFNIERSHKHKALNRKLQGGAADVMKKAMVEAYEAGLFEDGACGMPCLTVHDELDFDDISDPDNPAWAELTHVLENSMPQLRVPVRVDGSVGPNWGEAD